MLGPVATSQRRKEPDVRLLLLMAQTLVRYSPAGMPQTFPSQRYIVLNMYLLSSTSLWQLQAPNNCPVLMDVPRPQPALPCSAVLGLIRKPPQEMEFATGARLPPSVVGAVPLSSSHAACATGTGHCGCPTLSSLAAHACHFTTAAQSTFTRGQNSNGESCFSDLPAWLDYQRLPHIARGIRAALARPARRGYSGLPTTSRGTGPLNQS